MWARPFYLSLSLSPQSISHPFDWLAEWILLRKMGDSSLSPVFVSLSLTPWCIWQPLTWLAKRILLASIGQEEDRRDLPITSLDLFCALIHQLDSWLYWCCWCWVVKRSTGESSQSPLFISISCFNPSIGWIEECCWHQLVKRWTLETFTSLSPLLIIICVFDLSVSQSSTWGD